jgi:hypothetical protein
MSSTTPTQTSPYIFDTMNGRIQLSVDKESIGLLVERDGQPAGTPMDVEQARAFASALLNYAKR